MAGFLLQGWGPSFLSLWPQMSVRPHVVNMEDGLTRALAQKYDGMEIMMASGHGGRDVV